VTSHIYGKAHGTPRTDPAVFGRSGRPRSEPESGRRRRIAGASHGEAPARALPGQLSQALAGLAGQHRCDPPGEAARPSHADAACESRDFPLALATGAAQRQDPAAVLAPIHAEIHTLKRALASLERRASPFGKWSSLGNDSVLPDAKAIHAFPMSRAWPLAGAIEFLTKWGSGNVQDTGKVAITGNSPGSASGLREVANLITTAYYCSQDCPNQWICYDFKGMRICPRGYSIRTHGDREPYHRDLHLRSWVIETTNNFDSPNWTEIDHRENAPDLNGPYVHACFLMSIQPPEPCRYVRLRSTGPNSSNSHYLYITGLELFGELTLFE
jgi:hypothetical protein